MEAIMSEWMKKGLLVMAIITGCAPLRAQTLIQSTPSGARITIQQQKVGSTPYLMTYETRRYFETDFMLEKEGYASVRGQFVPERGPGINLRPLTFFGGLIAGALLGQLYLSTSNIPTTDPAVMVFPIVGGVVGLLLGNGTTPWTLHDEYMFYFEPQKKE